MFNSPAGQYFLSDNLFKFEQIAPLEPNYTYGSINALNITNNHKDNIDIEDTHSIVDGSDYNCTEILDGEHINYNRVCGIDVHLTLLVVCILISTEKGVKRIEAEFDTKQKSLENLTNLLKSHNIEAIVFESTGNYWLSLYDTLIQGGFKPHEIKVVNARTVKAIAGKKTDKTDAHRLALVARYGGVNASFILPMRFRSLREFTRGRYSVKKDIRRQKNVIHKHICEKGCRPSEVFSDITGKSARTIISALCNGVKGADLFNIIKKNSGRLKASPEDIYEYLRIGEFQDDWTLIQLDYEHLDHLNSTVSLLDQKIESSCTGDVAKAINLIESIDGIGHTTATIIVSEIGDDVSGFDSVNKFCAWLGLAPGNNISAGRKTSSHCTKGNKYCRSALIECANAISHRKEGKLVKYFERIKRTRGRLRAIVALAHKLARIIYAVLRDGVAYDENILCAQSDPDISLRSLNTKQAIRAYNNIYKDGSVILANIQPQAFFVEEDSLSKDVPKGIVIINDIDCNLDNPPKAKRKRGRPKGSTKNKKVTKSSTTSSFAEVDTNKDQKYVVLDALVNSHRLGQYSMTLLNENRCFNGYSNISVFT